MDAWHLGHLGILYCIRHDTDYLLRTPSLVSGSSAALRWVFVVFFWSFDVLCTYFRHRMPERYAAHTNCVGYVGAYTSKKGPLPVGTAAFGGSNTAEDTGEEKF